MRNRIVKLPISRGKKYLRAPIHAFLILGSGVETEFRRQDVCQGPAPAEGGRKKMSRGRKESASQDQQTLREFGEGSGTSIVLGIISIRPLGW